MDTTLLEATYETTQKSSFLVCSMCGDISHSLYPPDQAIRTYLESLGYNGIIGICIRCVEDTNLWGLGEQGELWSTR